MRKIIESALVSLDGVIGDPMSWASAYFNEDAQASALTQLLPSDGMLMGRSTYECFAPAWPSVPGRRVRDLRIAADTLSTGVVTTTYRPA